MSSNEQLSAFTEVYELGSYSSAARHLHKGRTTIRELVMMLEDELNLKLFNIVGRSAKPTADADKLYVHAKVLQEQMFKFKSLAVSMSGEQEVLFVICYDAIIPVNMMAELTANIHQQYPHTELQWVQSSWQEAMNMIAAKKADLAIFPNKKRNFNERDVASCFLGQIPVGLFCRPDSPLLAQAEPDKSLFRSEVQIINHNIMHSELKDYFRFSTEHIKVNDFDLVCQFLTKLGWGIVPLHCAARYEEEGDIKQLSLSSVHKNPAISVSYYYQPKILIGPVMTTIMDNIGALSAPYFD